MAKPVRSYIMLITSMLCWGSLYPISKYLMADIEPMLQAFFRYGSATAVLLPLFIIEIRKNRKVFRLKDFIVFAAAGAAGIAVFSLFLFNGISKSTASHGSILINTQPVFTAVLAPLLIRERISAVQAAGIAAGLAGMFIVVSGGNISALSGEGSMLAGNLLLLGGAVSMSLYGMIIKSSVKKFGGLVSTWMSMFFGTLMILLFDITARISISKGVAALSASDIMLIIVMGVVSTAAGYLLFTMSLKQLSVVVATGFKFLVPVTGIGLSIIFLGENPALITYAGIIIVFFSVMLIQYNKLPIEKHSN